MSEKIDYEAKYLREVEAHNETKKQLSTAKEQIAKLKKTVVELRPLRDMRDAIKPFMLAGRQEEQRAS